jgi:hypothetical protein
MTIATSSPTLQKFISDRRKKRRGKKNRAFKI